ncbi:hypothetical protein GBA52_008140, partial [Prunus armeniaca]
MSAIFPSPHPTNPILPSPITRPHPNWQQPSNSINFNLTLELVGPGFGSSILGLPNL